MGGILYDTVPTFLCGGHSTTLHASDSTTENNGKRDEIDEHIQSCKDQIMQADLTKHSYIDLGRWDSRSPFPRSTTLHNTSLRTSRQHSHH
jgi:hypothetical protein